MGTWFDGESTYVIRGNRGCEIWRRLFAELCKTGRIWDLSEDNSRLNAKRNALEYRRLARRFGRYRRGRTATLTELRYAPSRGNTGGIRRSARGMHRSIGNTRTRGIQIGNRRSKIPRAQRIGSREMGNRRKAQRGGAIFICESTGRLLMEKTTPSNLEQ